MDMAHNTHQMVQLTKAEGESHTVAAGTAACQWRRDRCWFHRMDGQHEQWCLQSLCTHSAGEKHRLASADVCAGSVFLILVTLFRHFLKSKLTTEEHWFGLLCTWCVQSHGDPVFSSQSCIYRLVLFIAVPYRGTSEWKLLSKLIVWHELSLTTFSVLDFFFYSS